MTMLSLLGSGFWFIDSKVFLPRINVFPFVPDEVIFLNILRSLGSFQGSWLSLPMPLLSVLARIRSYAIWREVILILN